MKPQVLDKAGLHGHVKSLVAGRKSCVATSSTAPTTVSTTGGASNFSLNFCTNPQCIEQDVVYEYIENQIAMIETDSATECSCACFELHGCKVWIWAGR